VSVDICVPLNIITSELVNHETGERIKLPPQKAPTRFTFLIRNTGDKHLVDIDFLIFFAVFSPATKINSVTLGSRSPLDESLYKATRTDNIIRVTAKRMNPGDFIFGDGLASGRIAVEVFSSSAGLTTHALGGPAECAIWRPRQPREAFTFFDETSP
jgi:hypothetical protein